MEFRLRERLASQGAGGVEAVLKMAGTVLRNGPANGKQMNPPMDG